MISDKKLRNSFGVSEIELGLNSFNSFERKKSANTQPGTSEYPSDNVTSGYGLDYDSQELPSQVELTIQELRLKLLKLTDYKANMELKFKRQIILLNNELAVVEAEQQTLMRVADEVKKDVEQMKEDLDFIKKCMENKQLRTTLSPDFSKCLKERKETDKFSPRSKPSKLFRANMLKIK